MSWNAESKLDAQRVAFDGAPNSLKGGEESQLFLLSSRARNNKEGKV